MSELVGTVIEPTLTELDLGVTDAGNNWAFESGLINAVNDQGSP